MRVGIATDHGGFELERRSGRLASARRDMRSSTSARYSLNPGDDYPDFVIPLARGGRCRESGARRGGLRQRRRRLGLRQQDSGVRAGLIEDHFSARQGVEDDHMNIICMGGRTIGTGARLGSGRNVPGRRFSQAERHLRRLRKVASLEADGR